MSNKSYETLIQSIGSMSVIELSKFIKELETEFGVSGMMPVAAATTAAPAQEAKQEKKSEYKVVLNSAGDKPIEVIKALRKVVTTMSLADAKKATESTPTVIVEAVAEEEAKKMKETLEAAGAKVELS